MLLIFILFQRKTVVRRKGKKTFYGLRVTFYVRSKSEIRDLGFGIKDEKGKERGRDSLVLGRVSKYFYITTKSIRCTHKYQNSFTITDEVRCIQALEMVKYSCTGWTLLNQTVR